jgi:archaemetzincin
MRFSGSFVIVLGTGALALLATLLVAQTVGRDAPEVSLGRQPTWWGEPRSVYLQKEKLGAAYEVMKPIHEAVPTPGAGDWLAQHKERGQSFSEYRKGRPIRPSASRKTIYVVRIGDFSEAEAKVLDATVEYLGLYFGVPVKEAEAISGEAIPQKARRKHPTWGDRQILTGYVLDEVLLKRRPDDALSMIALCKDDLWPGDGWNFVFGQASLRERVGVWSIYRNGEVAGTLAEKRTFLRRTLKTATHETGHMLTIKHCLAFQCNMNGANHQQESDRNPLWLCPSCLQKLIWNADLDPSERFRGLSEFYRKHGFEEESQYMAKVMAIWQEKGFVKGDEPVP